MKNVWAFKEVSSLEHEGSRTSRKALELMRLTEASAGQIPELVREHRGQDSGKFDQGTTAVTAAPAMCSRTHYRTGCSAGLQAGSCSSWP